MKTKKHTAIAALLILTGFLPSCVMPDPMFSKNARMIQDVNYPATKILGTWASFSSSPIPTETQVIENKTYYEIRSGGRGKLRQSSKNLVTSNFIAMEANLRWEYLGENNWNIMLPATSEYRVTDSRDMTMSSRGSRTLHVRYYQGDLYEMTKHTVLVPANRDSISELANRRRQQAPVLELKLN